MRWVGILMIAGACGAAPAAERLPAPVVAKGEVPVPPMPRYGGAKRIGTCAIRLEPADPIESARRENAIRARLPAGAEVSLTELRDRAGVVRVPIERKRLTKWKAERLAQRFVRESAAIWGAGHLVTPGDVDRDDRGRWIVTVGATPLDAAEWEQRDLQIVVRIDGEHGRLEAGLARDVAPPAAICDGPRPPLDRDRLRAAVIAQGRWRDEDVADPMPWLDVGDRVVRWIAIVPVGRDARAHMDAVDPQMRLAYVEALLLIDPDSAQILGERPLPTMEYDYVAPPVDVERVLGP